MTHIERPSAVSVVERLILALRLDPELYALASTERATTFQAFMVVVLGGFFNGLGLVGRLGGFGMWAGMAAALAGWLLWTLVLLLIARGLGHRRRDRSLARALGFANAPQVMLILCGVAPLAGVVRVLVVFWLLAATTVALQAVYLIERRRAAVITLIGFVVYLILGIALGALASL